MTSPAETVQELPIDTVLPSEHNPATRLRGLDELADSIREHGVLEPLLVTGNGHNSVHLVAGHRRLAAAKIAGLKTVPCIVRKFEESQQIAIQLVENLQREDLTPTEEAQGYGKLAAEPYRMSSRAIAKLVGRSQPHVIHRLALLKLAPAVLADYESGKLKLTVEDVQLLAQKPHAEQLRIFKETAWGSIKDRIRELKWRDDERRRAAERAKQPKAEQTSIDDPVVDKYQREADRARAEQRKQDKLRREANDARAELYPRLLGRGERELQYAAALLAETVGTLAAKRAGELLELKPVTRKSSYGQWTEWGAALFAHGQRSKKAAIDVLLALAIAEADERIRGNYAGGSPLSKLHIERLQKLGYKPNARDRQLLKVRR